jgi:hypothetical protein
LNTIQSAEIILNPEADKTLIDPSLVHMSDSRNVRQRIASARFSMQVGERTVIKTKYHADGKMALDDPGLREKAVA